MKTSINAAFVLLCLVALVRVATAGGGIAPEQIYQTVIDWNCVVGTWEVLPDENPLGEKQDRPARLVARTIMTLRKDGTCRVFDKRHPAGADALWTFEKHEMFVRFPTGASQGLFVYGVRGDYMVTRSPIKGGKDQLWSRVK